jgi:hypothetical protein
MAYSMVDLTKEMYAVFLQSLGQYLRFLLRKLSVELAFLVTLVMCVVHLRSSDICIHQQMARNFSNSEEDEGSH